MVQTIHSHVTHLYSEKPSTLLALLLLQPILPFISRDIMPPRISSNIFQSSAASSSRLFSYVAPCQPSADFRTSIPSAAIGTTSNTSLKIIRYPDPTFPERESLPKTHGIRVASLLISAHHPNKLDLFAKFAWHSAQSLGIPAARPAPREKHRELITVPKAPFFHKKYQENFERRHHHREIIAYDANRETIDLWLQYLAKNAVGGLGMKAQIY